VYNSCVSQDRSGAYLGWNGINVVVLYGNT